jgi:hypothetical protein
VVGTVVGYTDLPNHSEFRAVPGNGRIDAESYVLGLYLTGQTALRMPLLIAEFENFVGKGDGIPTWEI